MTVTPTTAAPSGTSIKTVSSKPLTPSHNSSPNKSIEIKKDSPAKILPISAITPPSGSLGKPLKVEVNQAGGRPSSLEVSPVKAVDKMARDFSPPRVTQDVKLG